MERGEAIGEPGRAEPLRPHRGQSPLNPIRFPGLPLLPTQPPSGRQRRQPLGPALDTGAAGAAAGVSDRSLVDAGADREPAPGGAGGGAAADRGDRAQRGGDQPHRNHYPTKRRSSNSRAHSHERWGFVDICGQSSMATHGIAIDPIVIWLINC